MVGGRRLTIEIEASSLLPRLAAHLSASRARRLIHALTSSAQHAIPPPAASANILADQRAKSVRQTPAVHLLGGMPSPRPDLATWNLAISRFNRLSLFDESLRAFKDGRSRGLRPDRLVWGSVVSACAGSGNLELGSQLYALAVKCGFHGDGYVCAGLIDLFSKRGNYRDALEVFWQGDTGNVVCWNAIITGGVRNEENSTALHLFRRMTAGFAVPNVFTISSVLRACAGTGDLDLGRGLHAWAVKCDAEADIVVGTAVVDLYVKCGDMDAALRKFLSMPSRNVVSWTAVMSGFVQLDQADDAVLFFKQMMMQSDVAINECTLTSVLLACSKSSMEKGTTQIHCLAIKNGLCEVPAVKDSLISTYARHANVQFSEKLFKDTDMVKSPSTSSAMICGFAQNQCLRRSLELFCGMLREGLQPDKKCCSAILSIIDSVDVGRQLHAYTVKDGSAKDILTGSALFTMYSKCGQLEESYQFFKRMPERDRVSWTSMISGFATHGRAEEAFLSFKDMIIEGTVPDQTTISSVLTACSGSPFLTKGKELHGHALRTKLMDDSLVSSGIVSMYFNCKHPESARRVFDATPQKDQVIWSYLVSGYATNGYTEEALLELPRMMRAGFEIDQFTCSSVLGVSANLLRLVLGRQLHAYAIKAGIISYLKVSSALVTLYSKCGRLDDSRRKFEETEEPDLVMWTAMVDSYAQHGSGVEALKIFESMKQNGVKPDAITLVSVLSACSRNGLLEEGFSYFNAMSSSYGIEPGPHHYACMVDLLGRSGMLKEAADFISKMPIEPDFLVWSTLLGAARVHGDPEVGKLAAKKVLELEPRDSGTFVSLCNISADTGKWNDVLTIRSSMKGGGLRKEPGWSVA